MKRQALIATSCLEGEGLQLRTCGVAKFWAVAEIQNLMANRVFFFFLRMNYERFISGSIAHFVQRENKTFRNALVKQRNTIRK